MWRTKYENIAKMYAQLRKEHLEMLNRYKDMQKQAQAAQQAIADKDSLVAANKAKQAEIVELSASLDRYKAKVEQTRQTAEADVARYKREAEDAKLRFDQLSRSKGAETAALTDKFNAEKAEQESKLVSLSTDNSRLREELRELRSSFNRLESDIGAKNEEIAVLQAGLDQSLLALQQLQQRGSDTEATLMNKMDSLSVEYRTHMDKILGKCDLIRISV
jgi:chromosome segregation ATPase